MNELDIDVLVFGGGAAGLWTLDELVRGGWSTLLTEAGELGGAQTVASQGIIHGGLKYTLGGLMNASALAIRDMPTVWRRSLAGEAQPDLTGTRVRAEFCHLWQTRSIASRLGMIGARAGLRVKPRRVTAEERPIGLRDVPGTVARLDEQVIDPVSFIEVLARRHRSRLLTVSAPAGIEAELDSPGRVRAFILLNPESGEPLRVRASRFVFAAGAGNGALREAVGLSSEAMQRRPLHMVMVRGELPAINGHCVDGARTRVTVTSATDADYRTVWLVGGQLAEDGVGRDRDEQIRAARDELLAVLPGIDLHGAEWATYEIDRAEGAVSSGHRPADAQVSVEGNVITAWPTKLALVPRAAVLIREQLDAPSHPAPSAPPDWPHPSTALPPWENEQQWISVS